MAEPVTLPLTGVGDLTTLVAVDDAGAAGVVQLWKLAVSADGSAIIVPADVDGLYVQTQPQLTSPQDELLVSADVVPGASADLNASLITNLAMGRLMGVDCGSSVAQRTDIQVVTGARVTRAIVYTSPGQSRLWRPPSPKFVEQAGNGTTARFGVSVTNLSGARTADLRATLFWDEV